jgi:hypothetical protein
MRQAVMAGISPGLSHGAAMFDTQAEIRLLLAILLVFAIWLVVSVPAYAVLSVWLLVRAAVANARTAFSTFVGGVDGRLTAAATRIRLELRERLRWSEIDSSAKTAWLESVEQIWGVAKTHSAELHNARSTASESLRVLRPILNRVKNLKLASQGLPTVPSLQQALESTKESRLAWMNAVIAFVLLVPIVAANAQMTGLVLSEVIPPVRPLLGIPIPLVVAMVLVIAEASIGVLHSVEAENRAETERAFTAMTAVWTLAAVAVIVIEALLYGFVQPEGVVKIPVADYVFFLVGGVLGLAVCGLGRMLHHSVATISKERTPTVASKHLLRLEHAAEEWNALATRLRPQQEEAIVRFERLTTMSAQASDVQLTALTKAHAEFERHRVALPPWATSKDRELTDAEFQEREARTYLWLFIWLLATTSLAVVVELIARRSGPSVGMSVGIATAVASFALGAFAGQAVPRGRRSLGVTFAFAFLVVVIAVAAARFVRGEISLHAIIVAVPATAAFLGGLQIGPDASLLRLPVWVLIRVMAMTPFLLGMAVLWAVTFATAIIEYALRILAWPVLTILSLRNRTPSAEHATV